MSWPILKQAGSFQSGLPAMACFKMGQIKVYLLIGLTGFKMGWPIIKWQPVLKWAKLQIGP